MDINLFVALWETLLPQSHVICIARAETKQGGLLTRQGIDQCYRYREVIGWETINKILSRGMFFAAADSGCIETLKFIFSPPHIDTSVLTDPPLPDLSRLYFPDKVSLYCGPAEAISNTLQTITVGNGVEVDDLHTLFVCFADGQMGSLVSLKNPFNTSKGSGFC